MSINCEAKSDTKSSIIIDYITLTQAAKIVPGRPSTNCLWRWCRKGVKSRSGVCVRLQHSRMGGKIYTTATWLDEFGKALAEADAEYFDLQHCQSQAQTSHQPSSDIIASIKNTPTIHTHSTSNRKWNNPDKQRQQHLDRIEKDLIAQGL